MNIIGISGSPRMGNSEAMLKFALEAAKEKGHRTNLVILREKEINFVGETKTDDVETIISEVIASDAIFVSSPCYYDMISPQLLNFLDLLDEAGNNGSIKEKKLLILMSGKQNYNDSALNAITYLRRVADIYGMTVFGVLYEKAEKSTDIKDNVDIREKIRDLINMRM